MSGYNDWFTASFSFPDGSVLGTADTPSMPWAPTTGSLRISEGRLTGVGAASISQGGTFDVLDAPLRLRFKLRFTDGKQRAQLGFNQSTALTGGPRISVDAAGKLSILRGATEIASTEVAPFETGVDWFVDAVFDGSEARLNVSRDNFVGEKQAGEPLDLVASGIQSTSGTRVRVELVGSGVSPSLDDVQIARCGKLPAPYQLRFLDTFERAALGNAEVPSASSWFASYGSAVIVAGKLELKEMASVRAPVTTLSNSGLRVRTTMSFSGSSLWVDVNYNGVKDEEHPADDQGFWFWGVGDAAYTEVFGGGTEIEHSGKDIKEGVPYFVQLDRDGSSAVLTVRTSSFDGPILLADYRESLSDTLDHGQYIGLSTLNAVAIQYVDDVQVDSYEAF